MKNRRWTIGTVALVIFALAATSCSNIIGGKTDPEPPKPEPATLIVQNSSSIKISYLYVSLASSTTWGYDQLGSNEILPGDQFALNGIPPDTYEFRATDSKGTTFWETGRPVQLEAGSTYTWTLTD